MPDIWKIHVWLNLLAKQAEVMTAQLYWPFMYRNEKKKATLQIKKKQTKKPQQDIMHAIKFEHHSYSHLELLRKK